MDTTATLPALVVVPVTPSPYWIKSLSRGEEPQATSYGHYLSDNVLRIEVRGRTVRYGVGYVSSEGVGRRTFGGPLVAGPWAYTFGLATVIDTHGGTGREVRANTLAGREHSVSVGDFVKIAGNIFKIQPDGTLL